MVGGLRVFIPRRRFRFALSRGVNSPSSVPPPFPSPLQDRINFDSRDHDGVRRGATSSVIRSYESRKVDTNWDARKPRRTKSSCGRPTDKTRARFRAEDGFVNEPRRTGATMKRSATRQVSSLRRRKFPASGNYGNAMQWVTDYLLFRSGRSFMNPPSSTFVFWKRKTRDLLMQMPPSGHETRVSRFDEATVEIYLLSEDRTRSTFQWFCNLVIFLQWFKLCSRNGNIFLDFWVELYDRFPETSNEKCPLIYTIDRSLQNLASDTNNDVRALI